MEFIDVPEIANVVTVEGSPCMSPVDQDPIYHELHSTAEQASLKGFNSYGDSPDHGYESDTINQKSYYNDFTEGPSGYDVTEFTDILTPSTGTYYSSAPMLSNVTAMMPATTMAEGPAPLKVEPSDEFVSWPTGTQSYTEALDCIDLTMDDMNVVFSQTSTANYDVSTCTSQITYCPPQFLQQPVMKCEPSAIWPYKTSVENHVTPCYAAADGTPSSSPYDDALLEISDNEQDNIMQAANPNCINHCIETPGPKRRRRKTTKQPILWKFLLDALNQPEKYSKMIHWVDINKGTFQFTSRHKEELSKDWGLAKRNRCTMTYQKMARALRNYINRGEVLRKVKRKLQYTFLPEFFKSIHHMVRQ